MTFTLLTTVKMGDAPALLVQPGAWPNLDERSDVSDVTCSIDGCARHLHARGLCEMHYRRLSRRGHAGPAAPQREARRTAAGSDRERFFAGIEVAPNDCWLWTGGLDGNGYGQFTADGRTMRVHRWAYEVLAGRDVPDGMHVDHRCHNADPICPSGACPHKRCANPDHLEVVTFPENIRRSRLRMNT